tara:strand:- start:4079 stop:4540 length:462 start_codon:yes stop_codon:yes gene_type:complete
MVKKKGISKKSVVILIAVLVLAGVGIYVGFYEAPRCESFECYRDKMEVCDGVKYVNEEPEASWGYEIKGVRKGECLVEVTLLQAKEGDLGIAELEGNEMECFYSLGDVAYPEKDLSKCHGLLKEDLQGIVIENLHRYLVENLGKVDLELNSPL